MDIKLHEEDLLSVVVSTSRLNPELAHRLLHFSQGPLILVLDFFFLILLFKRVDLHTALPEMTPLKVLTLARCIASSSEDGDLFKVAKRLQFCEEVRFQGLTITFQVVLTGGT